MDEWQTEMQLKPMRKGRIQLYTTGLDPELRAITGVEIVGIYLPFAKWIIVTGLVVLSVVKFMYVIFYFMHLRWDKPFCTILFFIGLVLAFGTVWALLAIFSVKDSLPLPT